MLLLFCLKTNGGGGGEESLYHFQEPNRHFPGGMSFIQDLKLELLS